MGLSTGNPTESVGPGWGMTKAKWGTGTLGGGSQVRPIRANRANSALRALAVRLDPYKKLEDEKTTVLCSW